MKATFPIILTFLALSSAQLPVPIPSLHSLTILNGEWYIIWGFDSSSEFPTDFEYSCYQWEISVNSDGGQIYEAMTYNGDTQTFYVGIENIGNPNTVWDSALNWVALDPVSQSWAAVGISGSGNSSLSTSGYILSRSPTLANYILNANIALLKGEQFPVSNQNSFGVSNSGCNSY